MGAVLRTVGGVAAAGAACFAWGLAEAHMYTVREAWAYLDEIDSGTVIVSNEAGDKDAAATPHDSQA